MFFLTGVLCALTVLLVTFGNVWSAWRDEELAGPGSAYARRGIAVVWLASLALAVANWLLELHDWLHLFWAVQIPLTSLFLCSGVLLAPHSGEGQAIGGVRPERTRDTARKRVVLLLAMTWSLGILPLLLQLAFPGDLPLGRNLGRPLARLVDLTAWGFGGDLPEALDPITDQERARGVGHLPREVTLPAGILLVAAWLTIAYGALVAIGRLVPRRSRRRFLVLSPTVVGLLLFLWPAGVTHLSLIHI